MKKAVILSMMSLTLACSDNQQNDRWSFEDPGVMEPQPEIDETPPRVCAGLPERFELDFEDDVVASDIAVDRSGCPHIAYYDDQKLRYATFDDGWLYEVIDVESPSYHLSIAVDSNGRPSIAFDTSGAKSVRRVVRQDDASWLEEELVEARATDIEYEMGPGDEPHIAIVDPDGLYPDGPFASDLPEVWMVTRVDSEWNARRNGSSRGVGTEVDFFVTEDAWYMVNTDFTSGDTNIGFSRTDAGPRVSGVPISVEGRELKGYHTLIAKNEDFHAVTCTRGETTNPVVHLRSDDGGEWRDEDIGACEDGSSCWCGDLKVDGTNRIHLVYGRNTGAQRDQVVYGVYEDGYWVFSELGEVRRTNGGLSMAVEDSGRAHILATLQDEGPGMRRMLYTHADKDEP